MASGIKSSSQPAPKDTEGHIIEASDALIGLGTGPTIFSSPQVVFSHTVEGDWVTLFDQSGEVVGDVSLRYEKEIKSLISRYHLSGKKCVVLVDPLLLEITPKVIEGQRDSLVIEFESGEALTVGCVSGHFVKSFERAGALGLRPVRAESWIRALPRYYEHKIGVRDPVLSLIFGVKFVELSVSQEDRLVAYHRLPVPGDGEEDYKRFLADLRESIEFFKRKHHLEIGHIAFWHAPQGWGAKLGADLSLKLVCTESGIDAHDIEVGAAVCLRDSVGPVWEVRHDRLAYLRQSFARLSAYADKLKVYGPLVWIGAVGLLFIASLLLLESRAILAESTVARWEKRRAAMQEIESRVSEVTKSQAQAVALKRMIKEQSQGPKFSKAAAVMAEAVPVGVYVAKVSYSDKVFKLSGFSSSWPLLLTLMSELGGESRFNHVSPSKIKRLKSGAIEFEVVLVPRQFD